MTLTQKHINILNTNADVIAQQVNTIGVMGAGLAAEISNAYPNVKTEYIAHTKTHTPDALMGTVFLVNMTTVSIANIYGQRTIRKNQWDKRMHTEPDMLKQGLHTLFEQCHRFNKSLAIPYGIGCGLGGGNWNDIYAYIQECHTQYPIDVTICIKP